MWASIRVTQKRFYTYTLAYPDEMGGHVFYVGKGTGDRMLEHEIEARRGWRGRKCQVIREIWANGYQVQKNIVYETDIEQDALIYEWAGITMIWASPYLTNTIANIYDHERKEQQKREIRSRVERIEVEPGIWIIGVLSHSKKVRETVYLTDPCVDED